MRILILEDDWSIAMDLEGIVAAVGHRAVGPVATATEALELVERSPPDLALLDIRLLDGVSGVTVAKHLKHRWGIPAIFVTASLHEATIHSDLAVALIEKPFTPDSVMDAIKIAEEVVNGKRPPIIQPRRQFRSNYH